MKSGPSKRTLRSKALRMMLSGSILFSVFGNILPGCDVDAQTVLVQGLEEATVAVVRGLFQQVDPSGGESQDPTGGGGSGIPTI